jgi:hypothetical protein
MTICSDVSLTLRELLRWNEHCSTDKGAQENILLGAASPSRPVP